MQMKSLGLIETQGLTAGVVAADAAVKSANVELVGYELTKGGGWTLIKIQGDVGAVKAAVDAARVAAGKVNRVVSTQVIARPSAYLEGLIHSADTVGDHKPEPPGGSEPPTPPEGPAEPQPAPAAEEAQEQEAQPEEEEEPHPEEPELIPAEQSAQAQPEPAEEPVLQAEEPAPQEEAQPEPPAPEVPSQPASEEVLPPEEPARQEPEQTGSSSKKGRKGKNKSK